MAASPGMARGRPGYLLHNHGPTAGIQALRGPLELCGLIL